MDLNEFKNKSPEWRIEAVIHDGQWYDKDKWSKQSQVDLGTLDLWINRNKRFLIQHENGSYRVQAETIFNWYQKQKLDIEKQIVPNNYPPRIWGGKTETQHFIDNPRVLIAALLISPQDVSAYNRAVEILKYSGCIIPSTPSRSYVYCVDSNYLKNILKMSLDENDYALLNPRTRKSFFYRDINQFPESVLTGMFEFYIPFMRSQLRGHYKTLSIFLPHDEEVVSQASEWLIQAMNKFDETKGVPFSGYLASVLRRWPYDLPEHAVGKSLATFQRELSRSRGRLKDVFEDDNIPNEILAKDMGYGQLEFSQLLDEHNNWMSEKMSSTITWDHTGEEKEAEIIGNVQNIPTPVNHKKSHLLSLAILVAANKTGEYEEAMKVISQMGGTDINRDLMSNLKEEYKEELHKQIKEHGFLD